MLETLKSLPYHRVKIGGIRQSADKSFAYILGVYMGDGCIAKRNGYNLYNFKMNVIDEDFIQKTANSLQDLLGKPVRYHKNYDSKYTTGYYYAINTSMYTYGSIFIEDTQSKSIIPEYVFLWDIELKKEFIKGLMDSEGYVAEQRDRRPRNKRFFMGFKACGLWVYHFNRLLETCGIQTTGTKLDKKMKEHYKQPYKFNIKIQSWIDNGMSFNIQRKNDRVNIWNSEG